MTRYQPAPRSWTRKFADACRGLWIGARGQASFAVHAFFAAAVPIAAAALGATLVEWCLLLLCVAGVLSAEYFNSALETMAKAIDERRNPHLADSLDVAAGAVLVAALGAALVGALVLGRLAGARAGFF